MKNVARLVLFFTSCLIAAFAVSTFIRFLHIRIDEIRSLPPLESRIGEELLSAVRWALPISLYISLLFSLSYTVRRRIFAPVAMLCLFILGSAACLGLIAGAEGFSRLAAYLAPPESLGNPGLILTQADNAIVLVQDPGEIWGVRVVSIPGQPLIYQEVPRGLNNRPISLPPIPFRTGTAWGLQSFFIDFSLVSRHLVDRFTLAPPLGGALPFMIYVCALVFFLVSLRIVLDLSNWPLANLFLGALAFRGIVVMETFLNSREVQDILNSFLGDLIPPGCASPLIFVFLGLLISLYTFLHYLARRREPYET
jgi:hypothetical protein